MKYIFYFPKKLLSGDSPMLTGLSQYFNAFSSANNFAPEKDSDVIRSVLQSEEPSPTPLETMDIINDFDFKSNYELWTGNPV